MPNRLIDGRDNPIHRTGLYKPIVGILSTIMVAFIFYQIGDRQWIDLLSTLVISFAFLQGAIVVAIFTDDWKWRIVGILIALGGTGLAYAFLAGNAAGHLEINTLAIRSTLRSSLATGGVITALGTWAFLYNRWRKMHTGESFLDPRANYRQ